MKLLELYSSVQGEGPNTGRPTQFIRFAGCNMRCPGWPCDTPQAIFPEQYTKEYIKYTPGTLAGSIAKYPNHLCVTGGEPYLQKGMEEFLLALVERDFTVDVFTNGSFSFPPSVLRDLRITHIMDWKLTGSGEAATRRIHRTENAVHLMITDGIKFVVKDEADLDEALNTAIMLRQAGCVAQFWVGSAWDQLPTRKIVEFMLENNLDWKLNVQMHKYIWPAEERYV